MLLETSTTRALLGVLPYAFAMNNRMHSQRVAISCRMVPSIRSRTRRNRLSADARAPTHAMTTLARTPKSSKYTNLTDE